MSYKPNAKTAQILDRAYDILVSVPYKVSARWLFYRLLQEGFYSGKDDYKNKFLPAVSMARHEEYGQWMPDSLVDETREIIDRGNGFSSPEAWMKAVSIQLSCSLSKWDAQPEYVEIWFEARAMSNQFQHYTQHVTLRPMGGQPSIPYKYRAALELSEIDKPITILYFGDLDPAGKMISEVVERDVRKWCAREFDFVHCGLNEEQVKLYNVPENFDKPGCFQWEALTDEAARQIIEDAVVPYIDTSLFAKVEMEEAEVTAWFRERFLGMADEWKNL